MRRAGRFAGGTAAEDERFAGGAAADGPVRNRRMAGGDVVGRWNGLQQSRAARAARPARENGG